MSAAVLGTTWLISVHAWQSPTSQAFQQNQTGVRSRMLTACLTGPLAPSMLHFGALLGSGMLASAMRCSNAPPFQVQNGMCRRWRTIGPTSMRTACNRPSGWSAQTCTGTPSAPAWKRCARRPCKCRLAPLDDSCGTIVESLVLPNVRSAGLQPLAPTAALLCVMHRAWCTLAEAS